MNKHRTKLEQVSVGTVKIKLWQKGGDFCYNAH